MMYKMLNLKHLAHHACSDSYNHSIKSLVSFHLVYKIKQLRRGYNESAHKFGHISSRLENNLAMAYLSLIFAMTANVDKFHL